MELIEGDGIGVQVLKTLLARAAQPRGAAIHRPCSLRAPQSAFGGNDYCITLADPSERPINQAFVMTDICIIEAMYIGRVDEISTDLNKGLDHSEGFYFIR